MIVQVIIRLIKYIDQAILRNTNDLVGTDPHRDGISNTVSGFLLLNNFIRFFV